MFAMLWSILMFPFRLIGWVVEMLGRFVGAALGFVLMVVGVALCLGPLLPLGVAVFVVGQVVLLKSLG